MQKGEPKMRAVHFSMVCDSRMWNASGKTCMCMFVCMEKRKDARDASV